MSKRRKTASLTFFNLKIFFFQHVYVKSLTNVCQLKGCIFLGQCRKLRYADIDNQLFFLRFPYIPQPTESDIKVF